MASQFPPKKNTAFNLGLSLYKNDGTLIANPGTITAKISKDFGDYADIGTVTEEDSTYGQIKLALTNTEMNADVISIYVVDNTSGCVPFSCTIYTSANLMDDIKTDTAAILEDTGTTLDTLIKDIPTNAEFELRSLPAADYTVVSDLGTVQTGDSFAIVNGDHGLVSIQDDIDAILTDTNELQTDWHDGGRLDLLLDGASAPSAATVADAVWDEALAGHAGAGSAGAALSAAGTAGDPWLTELPGAYASGQAGYIIGTGGSDTENLEL